MSNLNIANETNKIESLDLKRLPKDAVEVLEVLTELENFTAQLRRKLMSELRPSSNVVRIKLDNV